MSMAAARIPYLVPMLVVGAFATGGLHATTDSAAELRDAQRTLAASNYDEDIVWLDGFFVRYPAGTKTQ